MLILPTVYISFCQFDDNYSSKISLAEAQLMKVKLGDVIVISWRLIPIVLVEDNRPSSHLRGSHPTHKPITNWKMYAIKQIKIGADLILYNEINELRICSINLLSDLFVWLVASPHTVKVIRNSFDGIL